MTTRHATQNLRRLATGAVVALAVTAAVPLAAQSTDTMSVGAVMAELHPGTVVEVPILLRDASGTPLGGDAGTGMTIQMVSITVLPSPASAVASLELYRAGATASAAAVFEHAVYSGDRRSLIVAFDETADPLVLTLDPSSQGDQILRAMVTLSETVAITDVIALDLVAATTAVSNHSGLASETATPGSLALVSGAIFGSGLFADGFESGATDRWNDAVP